VDGHVGEAADRAVEGNESLGATNEAFGIGTKVEILERVFDCVAVGFDLVEFGVSKCPMRVI
jgi:hypothetical protein